MTLLVREIAIKVTITDSSKQGNYTNSNTLSTFSKKQLVKECVEKVLEELEAKTDR